MENLSVDDLTISYDVVIKVTVINDYNFHIPINSTILMDIDDSLLTFTNEQITSSLSEDLNLFVNNIMKCTPIMINKKSFEYLLERIRVTNSKLIFITQRNKSLYEQTKEHFDKNNIEFKNVIFTSGEEKGDYLKRNGFDGDNLIMIDDSLSGLINFKCNYPMSILYQFSKY